MLHFIDNAWVATISIGNQNIKLGNFKAKDAAANRLDAIKAVLARHG